MILATTTSEREGTEERDEEHDVGVEEERRSKPT
jgi:hypothetical protein